MFDWLYFFSLDFKISMSLNLWLIELFKKRKRKRKRSKCSIGPKKLVLKILIFFLQQNPKSLNISLSRFKQTHVVSIVGEI